MSSMYAQYSAAFWDDPMRRFEPCDDMVNCATYLLVRRTLHECNETQNTHKVGVARDVMCLYDPAPASGPR